MSLHRLTGGAGAVCLTKRPLASRSPAKAERLEADKKRQTVMLFDKSNSMIAFYPATVGSEEKPSPTGTLKVTEISRDPTYR